MENNYICEACESSNVEIDNSCNCAIVDIKCLDCGEDSFAIREDIQNEIDAETETIIKNDTQKGITPEIMQEFKEIISEFVVDYPKGYVLDNNERDELFDNLMDTMNKSKEKRNAGKTKFPG